jgi:AcrR family transcriptional regulator
MSPHDTFTWRDNGGVTGLRERKKEKTRDALVAAAHRQFARRGFDHVTVEEIAASCDVSPRTFFRYFASKEDVLFADSDERCTHLLEALAEQDPKASPLQALEAAVRELADDYAEQNEMLQLRHTIVTTTPSLRTRAAERQQGWESSIIQQLRSSGRARDLSDFDLQLLVAATITALRVAIEAWIAGDASQDLADLLDRAFARLRAGLDNPSS